jgi:hypothetical protein
MWVLDLPISMMKKLSYSIPKRLELCIKNEAAR